MQAGKWIFWKGPSGLNAQKWHFWYENVISSVFSLFQNLFLSLHNPSYISLIKQNIIIIQLKIFFRNATYGKLKQLAIVIYFHMSHFFVITIQFIVHISTAPAEQTNIATRIIFDLGESVSNGGILYCIPIGI